MSQVLPSTLVTPGFLRRNRVAIAFALGVLLVLTLLAWLSRDDATRGGLLDPENAKPGGARAVAQVLGDHGVPVTVVRSKKALADAGLDDRTTVMVTGTEALGSSTWKDLDDRVSDAHALLVVGGLSLAVADGLGLSDQDVTGSPDQETVASQCSPGQSLVDGLTLTSDEPGPAVPGDGCFGDRHQRQLLIDHDRQRWVLTNPFPVTNDQIDRGDNAAVVLRLLGQRDRVVWYVPDANDTLVSDGIGISRLLPDWLVPSLWLLAVAVLALLLWRARRLGPLVTEPLPVTIKALESTTTLGRLYERARDRRHAAGLLVEGSVRRLTARLGLSPRATRAELVRAVAERTGRTEAEVGALFALDVRGDTDLVTLAQNLHRLENEVTEG
ncbi:MAG: DUF4350 domain-containing protein [Nocardioidaceae bacterium]|nr:DUF4350 domain-containing protein [Nocardioidaceae bacterium]